MPHARADAIAALSELLADPAEKLVVSDRYMITAWAEPALAQLVDRDEPLSVQDVERIGIPRAVKVSALREQIFAQPRGFEYNVPCACHTDTGATRWNSPTHSPPPCCILCGTKCPQFVLCQKCEAMRCSKCHVPVGVVEKVIGRPKVSRSTLLRVFGGSVHDMLWSLSFWPSLAALIVYVGYKLYAQW
jgi:hypothetical protein